MPHVNGKSLLRVIKDNKKWKDVPVIITTATDPTEKEQTALFHLGAFSIAVKPITQDTLMQIIIRAVAAARLRGRRKPALAAELSRAGLPAPSRLRIRPCRGRR